MRAAMKHGVAFLLMGGALVVGAVFHGSAYWILAWPGAALAHVGVAYVAGRPRWLGKKDNGRLRPGMNVFLLPYFALVHWSWSLLRRVRTAPAYNELVDGIVIGRRLLAREVPPEMATIVDLTAEFRERYRVRSGRTYIACPVLDGQVPSDDELVRLLEKIRAAPKPVYIHCAEGHGRTGLVACALLISLGMAENVEASLEQVRAQRPRVTLSSSQRRQLIRMANRLTPETEAS